MHYASSKINPPNDATHVHGTSALCMSVIPCLHAVHSRCLNIALYITSIKQINLFFALAYPRIQAISGSRMLCGPFDLCRNMLYDWRTASTNLKLALVSLTFALLLFIIGFSTIYWVKIEISDYRNYLDSYGLWVHYRCEDPRGCHEDPLNSVYLGNIGWTGEAKPI